MPRRRNPVGDSEEGGSQDVSARHLERIANLLAVVATKDLERGEQIRTLNAAGFSQQEIAALLHTSSSAVRGVLFRTRNQRG